MKIHLWNRSTLTKEMQKVGGIFETTTSKINANKVQKMRTHNYRNKKQSKSRVIFFE